MEITLTYAFGDYTATHVVKDWNYALKVMASWSGLENMTWIRVQVSHVL